MRIHWTYKKVEQLLELTGLNMSQLAHILKVTPRMVAYIMRGDVGISKTMERKLNEFYFDIINVEKHMESIEKLKRVIEGGTNSEPRSV